MHKPSDLYEQGVKKPLRGGCLCGSVRYEVRGALGRATNCHCSMCRKAHGAAFGTYAGVQDSDFVLLSGGDDIAAYRSSAQVTRTFCRRCGSTLQFISAQRPGSFSLALGTLDDDPECGRRCISSSARRRRGSTSPTACRSSRPIAEGVK